MNELIKILGIDTDKPGDYLKIFIFFVIVGFVKSMLGDML